MQKYFLGIVPVGEVQDQATALKLELRDQMNVKYALKSPAHVTLKMPFSFNEAKENYLLANLNEFFLKKESFEIQVSGTGTFGKRVIFWKIEADCKLYELQESLKLFCKRELNLIDELSDRNFHPHMTIAFKDVKDRDFEKVKALVTDRSIDEPLHVFSVELLKRIDRRWEVIYSFPLSPKR